MMMQATQAAPYMARKWNLSGMRGISDKTLEMHFGLYEGYVKNTNLLREQITEAALGSDTGTDPRFAELVRRLGFEYNGMRLHELYFENLTKTPSDMVSGRLYHALAEAYGDVETWRRQFAAIGNMRGVGWAILFLDPETDELSNHWVTLHEDGNIAGFAPILVMDVWEHAYLLDHKPADRKKYIAAFLEHVDWERCELRMKRAQRELNRR
jgi:Fe-Mn family superoxide dismutase